jgi:SWI/SNF-related matrix-associated actin-dependent regulator 1 of chromatin subfamily A
LLQAEDRVHRIGTSLDRTVDIRYLICDNTLDDLIWPLIKKKLDIVGTTLDRHLSPAPERRKHFETQTEDEQLS